jgi:hypothetical protein
LSSEGSSVPTSIVEKTKASVKSKKYITKAALISSLQQDRTLLLTEVMKVTMMVIPVNENSLIETLELVDKV